MGDDVLGVSPDRLAHSLEVGRLAAEIARESFDWSDIRCQQMFLLGIVHDCGYEYAYSQIDHSFVGARLLKEAGYEFWREVRWHGIPSAPYASDELLILNIADMLVNGKGRRVSLSQRLADIEQRYGDSSEQYVQAQALAKETSEKLDLLPSKPDLLGELWK